ncbi:RNA-guided endonuclease InsQ/TnpB family protein [Argonema antarcticum]|uniref:RNA-guided endonuclease InsQ/TnpB family protein n=1 Tax=Argonema antarcticum TaxID=2942763 RepID=UPI002011E096|nr:RNA-guided endonuclease TnpB family protein [Argonema antarcticum]MCL1471743.1 transposase [Argonema antarcticum A004/B2]
MFAIHRELKLNNVERSSMRGMAGFKRFVYNYGLDLITASWDFNTIPATTKEAKTKQSRRQWHNRNKVLGNKKLGIGASNNAKRYYIELARGYARISNIRRDTIQKMTTDLSRRVYCIRIEDLNVSGMIANHKLARAVTDNCFYEVRRQLIYKQAHYGTKVEIVDRWYPSSKMCCKCRHIQSMKLSERVFRCQKCNHVQDRDENASVNLENAPDNVVRLA